MEGAVPYVQCGQFPVVSCHLTRPDSSQRQIEMEGGTEEHRNTGFIYGSENISLPLIWAINQNRKNPFKQTCINL